MFSAGVLIDLDMKGLQEKLMEFEVDPLELVSLEKLIPMLKEEVIMSPFQVEDIRLDNASREGLVVVMDLALDVAFSYPKQELRERYARLLIAKLEQTTVERRKAEIARNKN